MAFPVTLNGRTYTLADFSGTNYVEGFPAALEDFVTQAGNIYTTTSTSSVAIGTGSKTFTVADSGKPYTVGTPLRIADAAAPATNWIDAIVTSYSGTTLVVNAVAYAGSGTISSWNINIGGSAIAYTGTLPIAQGGTGATTAAAAATNIGLGTGDSPTFAGLTTTTADINGGTIDGTVIGGSTPAAISGTTITATGDVDISDKIVHTGDTNTAIRFPAADTVTVETAGFERMRITNSGNVLCGSDGGGDIGSSTKRFKDIYLSGGAYLGGATSANLLDDYEEGTWTPTGFTNWSVNPTFLSAPTYTKIGRTVTLFLLFSTGTTGTQARFDGVPFSGEGTGAGVNGAITDMGNALVSGTTCWFTLNSTDLSGARFSITYVV